MSCLDWVCVNLSCDGQVETGSDAPSECKLDQRVMLPAENGLSHTPIIATKPPSLAGQNQSAGTIHIDIVFFMKSCS